MNIRRLDGMRYASVEIEHDIRVPMSSVLRQLADWCEKNREHGLLTGIYTQSHPDDEKKFLTNMVWSID